MTRRKYYNDPQFLLPMGMLISNIGNGMYVLAVGMILYNQTGKTSSFALILVLEAVLAFLTQSFASIAADNGRAKSAAVISEILRGIIIVIAGFFSMLGITSSLVFAATLLSLLRPFYRTSIFTIGPLIAHDSDLAKYNARTSTYQQIGQFMGAGFAGIIIAIFSPYVAIFINGISYFCSAFFVKISYIPNQQEESILEFFNNFKLFSPKNVLHDWKEMILHLAKHRIILFIALIGTIDFVIVSFINLTYAPLLSFINVGSSWLSIWDSLFAIGAIIGVNLFGRNEKIHHTFYIALIALSIEGIAIGLLVIDQKYIICVAMLLLGITNAISVSMFSFTLQMKSKQEFMGRVSGIRQMLISFSTTMLIPVLSTTINMNFKKGIMLMTTIIIICVLVASFLLRSIIFKKKGVNDVD
ncbi:MFS family permease [Enterococcus rotai]|uniref:Major facilitator superfamily (MFS) profile domain-containing protein n=2 Tax=Enterococcus TaxID=1350 RepID=R2SVY8_9ENTE|nr:MULTISPECIES: MFS transporter [Enterococcus]ALS38439.1 hypothetical protein ATZ35_15170 [Enterococcus rotai]EOH92244.1 hypothetical protein UAW_03229 [Enterococcus haemoperoxidus ATCC BAA-382]EOT61929.1 hypothetical protein I583_00912 [Enterococcus haemoperoxidus ATCC BAA-382]OJG54162.1 hypothetical protein RV06_GL003115 [Enterococcus haemoperoxidus]